MMALLTVCQFADILAQLAIGIVAFVALHQIALVNTCSHVENLQGAEKTIAITDETTVKILTYLGRMCDGKDVWRMVLSNNGDATEEEVIWHFQGIIVTKDLPPFKD